MKHCCLVLMVIAFLWLFPRASLAQTTASPAASQPAENANVLGSVVNGNTTIVFEPANPTDIDSARLQTWGEFAEEHPRIANTLAYKPSLMNDAGYLRRHPELSAFFGAHPDIRDAMADDPGNYVAIPPRPGE
jgi:hypothetical protein